MSQRLAIATTLRRAGRVLDAFIRYHQAVGFDHLFLFFDDPDDPFLPQAQRYANVSVFANDAQLQQQWQRSRLFETRFAQTEVMARQVLNLEVAIALARERRIDWLLHIDHDELFYAGPQSVKDHFADLTARRVQGITYANYEAVPERVDIDDFFREVTLFKKIETPGAAPVWNERQKALLATVPQIPPEFYHFYRNGKSAARVQAGLRPDGVHAFRLPAGRPVAQEREAPVILHYTCCGFESFWQKFVTLERVYAGGMETWWGKDITHKVGSFYRDARAVVRRRDVEAARAFYERRYVIADEACIRALIAHDLCCRILEPARLLRAPA